MSLPPTRSTQRAMRGGRVQAASLPKSAQGRTLCRWCALEIPKRRRSFCSQDCVHQWRLRSSPAYLRSAVLKRDRGICARCTVDTLAAWAMLRRSRGARRQQLLAIWGLKSLQRRSLWDADHVLPVAEGGGECDLDNLRTLCVHCHRVVTSELRARLAVYRKTSAAPASSSASPLLR